MAMSDRRRRVLRALVEEYITSAHPVGSKTLTERYEMGCSPATVRSELAALEETGYVVSPHTSAGRMPTDTGYRSFVDGILSGPGPLLPTADDVRTEMSHFGGEFDDVLRESSALLTGLTHYLAVVVAPTVRLARVRRVDLLSLAPRRALFVLITEAGQVVNRTIDCAEDTPPERLADVERALNASIVGKRATEVRPLRDALGATNAADALMRRVVEEILGCLDEADRDRMYHVGVAHLLEQPEFADAEAVRPVVAALEEGAGMLDTLSDALGSNRIVVRIGHENRRAEFGSVSVIATKYGTSTADGVVGVLGPTRMDYGRAIAAVRVVADVLSDTFR